MPLMRLKFASRLSTHTGKPSARSELVINNYVDITKRLTYIQGVGVPLWLANKAYGCQSRHRHIATVYLKGIGVAMLLVLTYVNGIVMFLGLS